MKKFLFLFWCCILFGFTYAIEISADVLYLLAVEIISDWEATKEQMVWIFQSCEKNNKKLSKQCKEVLQKLWETEKQSETAAEAKLWILKEVIDWDTIKVEENGTTYNVRMIWLDAPESSTTRYWYIEEYGAEAKDHLKQLLNWKNISLEFDEIQGEEDKYWRKLAYVIVNGNNINKQMIEDGYGWEYTYNLPYKYQSEFKEAQKTAELKNNGLRDPNVTWWKRVKDSQSEIEELVDLLEGPMKTYSNTSSLNSSSSLCAGHTWFTGPRGWCYYVDWNSKVYDSTKVCCK